MFAGFLMPENVTRFLRHENGKNRFPTAGYSIISPSPTH
jgi:hypothetical protein